MHQGRHAGEITFRAPTAASGTAAVRPLQQLTVLLHGWAPAAASGTAADTGVGGRQLMLPLLRQLLQLLPRLLLSEIRALN